MIASTLQNIHSSCSPAKAGDTLYKLILPKSEGVLTKLDGVTNGNVVSDKGKIVARARFKEVNSLSMQLPALSTMLGMMVIGQRIDAKLSLILKIQQSILSYLEMEQQAKTEGSFRFLFDTLQNYKYNWTNPTYTENTHMKIQDIKQEMSQQVVLQSKLVIKEMSEAAKTFDKRYLDKIMQKTVLHLQSYQIALRLYGLSSFAEILLLQNFEDGYLSSAFSELEQYSLQYREIYSACYSKFSGYFARSIQTKILSKLSTTGAALGQIAKTAFGKSLSEAFQQAAKSNKQGNKKALKLLELYKDPGLYPFLTSITEIKELFNNNLEVIFDNKNLYIKAERKA